jgi:hypothetical protein
LRSLQEIQPDFEEEAKAYAGLWSQGKKKKKKKNVHAPNEDKSDDTKRTVLLEIRACIGYEHSVRRSQCRRRDSRYFHTSNGE